jgi:Zn-finger protein
MFSTCITVFCLMCFCFLFFLVRNDKGKSVAGADENGAVV